MRSTRKSYLYSHVELLRKIRDALRIIFGVVDLLAFRGYPLVALSLEDPDNFGNCDQLARASSTRFRQSPEVTHRRWSRVDPASFHSTVQDLPVRALLVRIQQMLYSMPSAAECGRGQRITP